MRKTRIAVVICLALASSWPLRGGPSEVRSGDRLAYALTGARVIVAPGRVIENGVVVVRGGVIEAAGPQGQTAIPADARVFDLKGKVVHAAFIDPTFRRIGWPGKRLARRRTTRSAEPAGRRRTAATAPRHRPLLRIRPIRKIA
jgi:hypothetical protein